ncbi:alkyldihydroxyacetonephosphate synthase [Gracilibacillus orientalis]|uniref:Alkyldihydroxyacetonephosphate synthase n=1 Tax=Gracilibacillus orientalis TaxID=334253 RepID=A0A1I4P151_9BACI|nr:FAD-binding oxidoreductase [Gracilibacillus orientalis]SFM21376.1 alkyldihydroxyacetonephosphate synthase [Gracilibacillus orientalis]
MVLSKEQIVSDVKAILSESQVITDEEVLRENSVDRFRKYETIHEVYTQPLPAAVVKIKNEEQVSHILKYMNEHKINAVPRTGGSATEGGLETAVENSLVIDGSEMDDIVQIDPYNMLATVQCGVPLENLEDKLREQGLTTGHSPQSKPLAQMGGLVATRSIGQLSTLYGGIEDMVVGVEAVFPNGEITKIKNVPRRAAGPDIRHVIIGNEGALCYITEVTVKVFQYKPENNQFYGYLLDDMKTGFEMLREVMVQGYRPSVARLYDPEDAAYHFDFSEGKCVLIFMAEGPKPIAEATGKAIEDIVAKSGKSDRVESHLIQEWFENLNWDPSNVMEERKEIKQSNNIGFTTEVSGSWGIIHDIYENCIKRIREEIPHITMLGGHSSHSYMNGTNMYFIYYYDLVDIKPEEEITKYHYPINKIIVEETIKAGGSMVHHHGVGKHRTPWIKDEYGSSYYILETLKKAFDPNGIMNKGTIFPMEE